jgi:hypothetical protein
VSIWPYKDFYKEKAMTSQAKQFLSDNQSKIKAGNQEAGVSDEDLSQISGGNEKEIERLQTMLKKNGAHMTPGEKKRIYGKLEELGVTWSDGPPSTPIFF